MELFGSYSGTDFLFFFGCLLAAAALAGLWIPANLRPEGRKSPVTDAEEAAVLAGGVTRHAMAVSADLMAREGLVSASKNKVRVNRTELESGSAGRSVLRKIGEFDMRELRLATKADGEAIADGLERRGLLMDAGQKWRLRWLSISPYLALIALGLYRFFAGEAEGEPTGRLMALLFVAGGLALWRFLAINPRTRAGNEVLRDLEEETSRLRRAPVANEAGFAVALFGTAVLVGTPWEQVHAMRQAGSGGDGGGFGDSDSDGGGGDGGGCGGGCGGCGG